MPEIRPFRGVRYDPEKIGDIGGVVAPPYDVIDAELQEALHEAHPNNIVRITRGKDRAGDSDRDNRHTRAAQAYRVWRETGILKRDREEGIYVCVQDFTATAPCGPVHKSRLGIVALVRVQTSGEGSVLPHEYTMPAPKADRLELMRHTDAAFGQIFSLYSDPEQRVQSFLGPFIGGPPLLAFRGEDGVGHRLWRVTDREAVEKTVALLSDGPLLIADGHHRYETAVAYRDLRMKAEGVDPRSQPYGYSMQTLVNADDAGGMAIYPIHRVAMDLGHDGPARLAAGLEELFDVDPSSFRAPDEILLALQRKGEGGRPVFGFCTGDTGKVRYLSLKPSVDLAALDAEGHCAAWHRLSSGLLQMVLGRILGLDEEALTQGERIRFVKSESRVLSLLNEAPDRAGFLLNPVGMDQLHQVVRAGERMPPKSTFFYPKVCSGLVIQDLSAF